MQRAMAAGELLEGEQAAWAERQVHQHLPAVYIDHVHSCFLAAAEVAAGEQLALDAQRIRQHLEQQGAVPGGACAEPPQKNHGRPPDFLLCSTRCHPEMQQGIFAIIRTTKVVRNNGGQCPNSSCIALGGNI
eukprot:CAMPEP_0202909888 /NCGR_PEP_ID=MMETSP1392-20130828/50540_1 /ASSEMBLY_ACC=CAM_ASM_000868 /TAXON_ID=225041 /ORGANISM="Chlamydomonas chlamydogama, Strain SAG 11-48b" /LENGTH=131 /DNA_ID=CAMNT_0049599785 /DNA_START=447 /DNA_END=842 /DNA_ORIENTATION=-